MTPQQTLSPDRKDELLTVLAHAERRRTLSHLRAAPDDVATVRVLTDALAADDADDGSTAVRLVHSHLPKMEAAGVVEYDQRSETVRYQATPPVEQLLDAIADV